MKGFKVKKAYLLQRKLSQRVSWEGGPKRLSLIAGFDVAFTKSKGVGVVALLTYPELKLVKYSYVVDDLPIPYIPGLLAFREAPLLLAAYEILRSEPDLLIVDGHGVTHPRGFGLASHLGVILDRPAIGAAKKRLVGEIIEEGGKKYLISNGRKAALLYPPASSKPIYLSIGHKVGIDFIEDVAPKLFRRHKLPVPTYVADRISKEVKSRIVQGNRR